MNTVDKVISFLAIIFTTFQLLPQVYKTFRTKQVRDLSYTTLWLWLGAAILWNLHSQSMKDYALMFSTSITSLCCVALLIMFHLYK